MLTPNHPPRETNYQLIWKTVRLIPKGRVATYGEIAEQAEMPGQARLVGYALHNLPDNSSVPWQRVVNRLGVISFPKNSALYARQKKLLQSEGVQFVHDRIDLKKFGWLAERAKSPRK